MSFVTAPSTIAQVLILTVGIYVLLSFLRATRGSGLVRGLGLGLIVGVYGLWGVAGQLNLLELKHVIQGLLGFVFVILAIIFQPELRRVIVSMGENRFLGRFLKAQRNEVATEVAAAVVTMAKNKQGALIAFERNTPLDAYIEGAVKLDAEVNRYLLDSIFHHGSALHDGAVIVRGDRVVAAASLFPLTENIEISKSTGTRHRAALGVTEETDAVSVAVSEETGLISICQHGKIERRVPRAQIEEVLRERIGAEEPSTKTPDEDEIERAPWILRAFTEHAGQKLGALVLAILVFYGAHQDIIIPKELPLRIERLTGIPKGPPAPGTLQIVPAGSYRLTEKSADGCRVEFEGTRDQLASLTPGVSGVVTLAAGLPDGEHTIAASDISWTGVVEGGVSVRWLGGPPVVVVENLEQATILLTPAMIEVDDSVVDPRYEVVREGIAFRPTSVTVRGPVTAVQELRRRVLEDAQGGLSLLGPVVIGERDTLLHSAAYDLSSELLTQRLALDRRVDVDVPIRHRVVALRPIEVPIALAHLGGANGEVTRQFEPTSGVARFKVFTRGLISGEEGSTEWIADSQVVRDFVAARLRALIDVDRIPEGSRVGTVVSHGLDDWELRLPEVVERLQSVCKDPRSDLWVEIETQSEIHLKETTGTGDEQAPGGDDA